MLLLGQYRYQSEEYTQDPVSTFVYPVFDTMGPIPDRHAVAILATNIYWRLFFQNALPEDATGVMVVLENTQGQVYTYRVDGPVATYIGPDDLHDATYDDLGHVAHMASYIQQRTNPTTRSYTTVELDDSYL